MKKMTLSVIALIIVSVIMASLIAGCNRNRTINGPEDDPEISEFVFLPEFISLPAGIMNITNITVIGEKLFFAAGDMDESNFSYTTKLYSMDFDGTNVKQLENYSTGEPPEIENGDVHGNESVLGLFTDADENLWVAELGQYYFFDLPEDFDQDNQDGQDDIMMRRDMYSYYTELESKTTVRKLDSTGAELASIDISNISNEAGRIFINTVTFDGDGNIYVADSSTIHVLDNTGRSLFKLDVSGWIDQLIRTTDGSIAFLGYMDTMDNNMTGRGLRTIDVAARGWGDTIELPINAYQIFPGGNEHSFLFTDNLNLFGFDEETGESVKLLNWIDSDVSPDGLGNITLLPDGRVLCTTQSWDRGTGMPNVELVILTQVPADSIPHRTTLTLAAMWIDWDLRNSIVTYNRNNPDYRIQVNDYSEFNTEEDYQAGLTRLTTEIMSGNIPDMLLVSNLPYTQYAARGLLEDLYPYIDADPVLSRGALVESAFRAVEMDGALYQVFSNFSVNTLSGRPSVLGGDVGWNMEEFMAVIRANPQATMPLGPWMSKNGFLQQIIMMSIGEYIDWSSGRTYFDSDDFISLLEFADTFPDENEIDWEEMSRFNEIDLISEGLQIMRQEWLSDFRSIQMQMAIFGGEIVFKGYPSPSRSGHVLSASSGIAITTSCSDKDGAWQFIRTILTEDWQRSNMRGMFPTNRAVFNEQLTEAMTPQTYIDEDGNEVEISMGSWGWNGFTVEMYAMKQAEADQILDVINSVSGIYTYDDGLMTIITEGAGDFFSGRSSAGDAARVIQSRASIYVAEQS